MNIKKYSYQGIGRMKQMYMQMGGLLAIIIFTGIGLFFFAGTVLGPLVPNGTALINDPRSTMICVGTWSIGVAWIIGSIMVNAIPTIWLDDHGITVSTFLFFRKHIPWHDVIDVSPIRAPFDYLFVRVRKLTFFHRAIGWIYTHSLYPGFLIANYIDDHEDLIWRIRRSMPRNK